MRISDRSSSQLDNPKIRALHTAVDVLHKLSQDLHDAADQALREHDRKNRPFKQKIKDMFRNLKAKLL